MDSLTNDELNIDNYSTSELLDIFDSEKNNISEYNDVEEIDTNCSNIIESINESENKQNLVHFINEVKERLISEFEDMLTDDESNSDTSVDTVNGFKVNTSVAGGELYAPTIMRKMDDDNNIIIPPNEQQKTITQDMSIDTRFRKYYYNTLSTNFGTELQEIQKNVTSMRVSAIEMPMTYYSISESYGNNKMLIISDVSNINDVLLNGLSYTDMNDNILPNFEPYRAAWLVEVVDGNYDTTSWYSATSRQRAETAINDAITLATPGAINNSNVYAKIENPTSDVFLNSNFVTDTNSIERQDIRFTINRITGKSIFATPYPDENVETITFQYNTSETNRKQISILRFNIDSNGNLDTTTNIQTRLGWMLGFRAAEYIMATNTEKNTPIAAVSEGIGFINSPRYAFLSINDHNIQSEPNFIVNYNTHTIDNNIITRINLAGGGYHNLASRDAGLTGHSNRTRKYFNPVNIQKLTIKLHDEFGRIIDLNNMDWSLTLTFTKLVG
tara:strand:- start:8441 stop:9943 length:1503 start_codon:yes stop_codon:yes gene_type:complete